MEKEIVIVIIALALTICVLVENLILRDRLKRIKQLMSDTILDAEDTLQQMSENNIKFAKCLEFMTIQKEIIKSLEAEISELKKEGSSDNNRHTGTKKRTPPGNV